MSSTVLDETRLKALVKEALVELLRERKGMMRELVAEAIEDIALSRAIEEGLRTETVDRDTVFRLLEREP